ncbi:MAG: hypothetical protein GX905_00255 [Bacteroidales bacterium]|nr:hypothetical protein [Bacteroidales bacterium]
MNLLFMRPDDVDIISNTVKGQLFDGDGWVEVITEIPLVIDSNPPCFRKKYQSIIEHLRKHSNFTYDGKGSLNKHTLLERLKQDERFSYLVIPSIKSDDFEDIIEFLDHHEAIVLKPIYSDRGRGVYKLFKEDDSYVLSYLVKDRHFNKKELEDYFNEFIKGRNYVCQKYISSRTKQGDPFDCRIHVQKDGKGRWIVVKNYIRIGIGQKVISNVNQGGGISDLVPFLKANYDDQWKEINREIKKLAKTLPDKIESLKGTPTMALGFDVAISKSGELYLFESNGAPAIKTVLSKTSQLRVQYYQYMLNNITDKNLLKEVNKVHSKTLEKHIGYEVEKIKRLENRIAVLENEREFYKEEYSKMKESSSWKLTVPVRKIGSLKKKFGKNK